VSEEDGIIMMTIANVLREAVEGEDEAEGATMIGTITETGREIVIVIAAETDRGIGTTTHPLQDAVIGEAVAVVVGMMTTDAVEEAEGLEQAVTMIVTAGEVSLYPSLPNSLLTYAVTDPPYGAGLSNDYTPYGGSNGVSAPSNLPPPVSCPIFFIDIVSPISSLIKVVDERLEQAKKVQQVRITFRKTLVAQRSFLVFSSSLLSRDRKPACHQVGLLQALHLRRQFPLQILMQIIQPHLPLQLAIQECLHLRFTDQRPHHKHYYPIKYRLPNRLRRPITFQADFRQLYSLCCKLIHNTLNCNNKRNKCRRSNMFPHRTRDILRLFLLRSTK
jgi:hypothetical protein